MCMVQNNIILFDFTRGSQKTISGENVFSVSKDLHLYALLTHGSDDKHHLNYDAHALLLSFYHLICNGSIATDCFERDLDILKKTCPTI